MDVCVIERMAGSILAALPKESAASRDFLGTLLPGGTWSWTVAECFLTAKGCRMPSDSGPILGKYFTVEELMDLLRANLRLARSCPPGNERNGHRRIAKSLRTFFASNSWLIERLPASLKDDDDVAGAPDYRAYFVGADGHYAGSRAINVSSDAAAITSAKKMLDGKDIEIWAGLRKIIRLPHLAE